MFLTTRSPAFVAFIVSLAASVLGLAVFALPATVLALGAKLTAASRAVRGQHVAARDRFALALLLEIVALISWGSALLAPAAHATIAVGLIGIVGTGCSWICAVSRAEAARRRWGLERQWPAESECSANAGTARAAGRPSARRHLR